MSGCPCCMLELPMYPPRETLVLKCGSVIRLVGWPFHKNCILLPVWVYKVLAWWIWRCEMQLLFLCVQQLNVMYLYSQGDQGTPGSSGADGRAGQKVRVFWSDLVYLLNYHLLIRFLQMYNVLKYILQKTCCFLWWTNYVLYLQTIWSLTVFQYFPMQVPLSPSLYCIFQITSTKS